MDNPFKNVLVIDFESVWGDEYTLTKMTTEEYVRDERFHAYGCGVAWLDDLGTKVWVPARALKRFFAGIDWAETSVLAHNASFDVAVLSWVYGHVPGFIFDSLSMSRAKYGTRVGNSLAALAERYELPPKGTAVYSTKNVGPALTADIERELAGYCLHDVYLCAEVFMRLVEEYPASELRLIDLTLRMFVDPQLVLDVPLLEQTIQDEAASEAKVLSEANITKGMLSSNAKFADLLTSMGVVVPMKISPRTHKPAYALAKSDTGFQALLSHTDDRIAALCRARLKVKSTLLATRSARMLSVAQRGSLPVPLQYYGALTGRYSASDEGLNLQNLPRKGALRRAILAPPGYVIGVGDLAQIEVRVLAWLAGFRKVLNYFRDGADPYGMFGAEMFNIPGLTKETHPDLRQAAKSALIGAGYGLGWLRASCAIMAGFQGAPPKLYDAAFLAAMGGSIDDIDRFCGSETRDGENFKDLLLREPHACTDDAFVVHATCAWLLVKKYRASSQEVVDFWGLCTRMLTTVMMQEGATPVRFKCLLFAPGRIELPNGMNLRYPNLRRDDKSGDILYDNGKEPVRIYGGKIVENLCQALARLIMTDGMLRTAKRYRVVLTVHDEQGILIPEREKDAGLAFLSAQMVKAPSYMPGIPLAVEVGAHVAYGKAKP